MSQTIQLSAIGLCTSLGGYSDACAAFRAGITRYRADSEIAIGAPGDDEPTSLTVSPIPEYLSSYQGKAKLVKMLSLAYQDLIDNYQVLLPTDNTVFFLATPDPVNRFLQEEDEDLSRDQRLQSYINDLIDPLSKILDVKFHNMPMQCLFGGRIAFARALEKAIDVLSQGEFQYCLIAVVESLLSYDMLVELISENQLKTANNPVGYIPGEGAAFFLLSSQGSHNQAINCTINVSIDRETLDLEDKDSILEKWQGQTLYQLMAGDLQKTYENTALPQIISDFNAQEHRATELSLVQTKLQQAHLKGVITEAILPALLIW